MSEPLRTAPSDAPATETEREAMVERLLLAGLDHYFEGRYEQAVNVWTRVAFLERGHGRARAYIERARGALAERQRRTEEIVHQGVAAYDAGDFDTARRLLTQAVADGGANDTALIFLQRLGRVEAHDAAGTPSAPASDVPQPHPAPTAAPRRPAWRAATLPVRETNWVVTAAASVAVAAAILLAAQPIASWLGERPMDAPVAASQAAEPLPIVRASDVRIARARDLHASGRLREALRLLDEVEIGDPLRGRADQLKADVQRDLLAAATAGTPASAGDRTR